MSIRHWANRFWATRLTAAVYLGLCWSVVDCQGQPPAATEPVSVPGRVPPKERPLKYWVDQLSHAQFYRREVATRQLAEAGLAAVPILTQSIASGDLEATERAIQVLGMISLDQSPSDESGAWGALNELVNSGTGSRRARAKAAIGQIWRVREVQARKALVLAGVFVGMGEFAIGPLRSQVQLVRVDDDWSGDIEVLGWLRWLRDVRHVSVVGASIRPDVIESVVRMPDVGTIVLIDGELDLASLEPLKSMKQLNSLEIRYILLPPEIVDAIEKLPMRESLNLRGTAVKDERVALMREQLPGLTISHWRGGFLGVTCDSAGSECRIRKVDELSAAYKAGLLANDVIVGIDDVTVEEFADLQQKINQHLPGDELTIRYLRQGDQREVKLKLGKLKNR